MLIISSDLLPVDCRFDDVVDLNVVEVLPGVLSCRDTGDTPDTPLRVIPVIVLLFTLTVRSELATEPLLTV